MGGDRKARDGFTKYQARPVLDCAAEKARPVGVDMTLVWMWWEESVNRKHSFPISKL